MYLCLATVDVEKSTRGPAACIGFTHSAASAECPCVPSVRCEVGGYHYKDDKSGARRVGSRLQLTWQSRIGIARYI